jgi:hypothetical protein
MLLCCCASTATTAPPAPAATATPAPVTTTPKPACASAERRQLDFWIGDWDVAIRARASPTSEQWGHSKGRQRIEAILDGCAIAETFTADGPQAPWAGRSYSSWQPALGKWRQTWVDDSGGYIALTGGIENGDMTLYGEPRTVNGESFQMRMVFKNVTADALLWEWQRSTDSWKTHIVMMAIDYKRRR